MDVRSRMPAHPMLREFRVLLLKKDANGLKTWHKTHTPWLSEEDITFYVQNYLRNAENPITVQLMEPAISGKRSEKLKAPSVVDKIDQLARKEEEEKAPEPTLQP